MMFCAHLTIELFDALAMVNRPLQEVTLDA